LTPYSVVWGLIYLTKQLNPKDFPSYFTF